MEILIQIPKIHAHTDGSMFLVNRKRVRNPFCKWNQIDETRFEELLYLNI
jgi:hypothetical protein